MTLRTFDSFCNTCAKRVTLNSKILLTQVTKRGLQHLGLDKNMWPHYVTDVHTNPRQLNCVTCNTRTTQPVLSNVSNSKFLFIEFPPGLMKDINVFELIEITGVRSPSNGASISINFLSQPFPE